MKPGTLSRYFGFRFFGVFLAVFGGLFALTLMIDFVEMLRRTGNIKDATLFQVATITFFRAPHITERVLPFTALISAMVCYLSLSRRLELVIARAAGVSAWQFVRPAIVVALLIGVVGVTLYNPVSAYLREQSQKLETEMFGSDRASRRTESGFWTRQRSADGQSIINARGSRLQGVELTDVTFFNLDESDRFLSRIDAKKATLHDGYWRLETARIYAEGTPPSDHDFYELKTALTRAQVQESFATPETVPFWQLSTLIQFADNAGLAAIGYRLQYYQLLATPFYLIAMVLLAASVSLRLFRFGGVQKMILGGITSGFLLYILSKVTGDLSKASLLTPVAAAALPPLAGALTGIVTLLYMEDG